MLKKILFLGFTASILMFSNNLFAEINSVVPLKKPVLSKEEIQKKISINILKPLKKPSKTKEIKIKEVIVKKELVLKEKKLSFKIPKKKPTVAGISSAMNIKISKYYSKRDFGLAKKAISEMQKSKWSSALKIGFFKGTIEFISAKRLFENINMVTVKPKNNIFLSIIF